MKKPKHISSFNMNPTDNVIQLGWNFLSQNETLAVSIHPTKRLIAVLTKQNFFKIFTFDGYFVTLVNNIQHRNFYTYSSVNTSSSMLLLEDIIMIIYFGFIIIYTDNEIARRYFVGNYEPTVLDNSDENRHLYDIHIFIPDQASFEKIQLFSIEQDTMVVIPRAEICDEVSRIYTMSISEGTIIAKYTIDKSPTVEGYPRCVSIDRAMNTYILTPFSDVIHFLSPDGEATDIQLSDTNRFRRDINNFILSKKFEKTGKYHQILTFLSQKPSRIANRGGISNFEEYQNLFS